MIQSLSVENFKSIKEMDIDCRRINLFIGEPNTGKSNILEVLGLLSWLNYNNTPIKEYIRFNRTANLFYDGLLDNPIIIWITNEFKKFFIEIKPSDDSFRISYTEPVIDTAKKPAINTAILGSLNYSGEGTISNKLALQIFVKFYRFKKQASFSGMQTFFLMPPYGDNMFALVKANKKLRETVANFFKDEGFLLMLREDFKERKYEGNFDILKQTEDTIVSYPYVSVSDTLQRAVFYTIAIESNENSTLIFEEPEAHAFPYYTKYLGEKIASDEKNQYFIATHNPYLLLPILEKAPKDDVNVFITYFKDYQTKVKRLEDEEKSRLMAYDPFANLDFFIAEEKQ